MVCILVTLNYFQLPPNRLTPDVACVFFVSFPGNGFRGLHKISCWIWHCIR